MICTKNSFLCLGVSLGNRTMARAGMRMQIKSILDLGDEAIRSRAGFVKHKHGIRPVLDLRLGIGPSAILTANESRIMRWNYTSSGRIQSGNLCLTAMRCENRLPDEEATSCNPNSEYPIWQADELRRGVYVKLYECLYRMYGQQWNVTEIPMTDSPTAEQALTTFAPSSSPTMLVLRTNIPSRSPTGAPVGTTEPTLSPTRLPFSETYSPSYAVFAETPAPSMQNLPSQIYSNVETSPLYAIPIAICILILIITTIIFVRIRYGGRNAAKKELEGAGDN